MRASGDLVVLGIAQEQHPDRTRLFAQWHEIDWPILWDPFNLTGSTAVPGFTAIDEHGVVRSLRPRPETFEDEFLFVDFDPPARTSQDDWVLTPQILAAGPGESPVSAVAWFLGAPWSRVADGDPAPGADAALALLERAAREGGAPADLFRLGVARRLRFDSRVGSPSDFRAAVEAWGAALAANPNQYVWRRRLQQYGPRLDKPYDFYGWVDQARAAIRARGAEPVAVLAGLTDTERAGKGSDPVATDDERDPDPEGEIERDEGRLVSLDAALVFHTDAIEGRQRGAAAARAHVALWPERERGVHWTNDAGAALVWIDRPPGWRIDRRLFRLAVPAAATSDEARGIDFELRPEPDAAPLARLRGHALYYVCEGDGGRCIYRRQDFELELAVPGG